MNESLSLARLWSAFACAAISRQQEGAFVDGAAKVADDMTNEFRKRFEWYEGQSGNYWKRKTTK